MASAGVYGFALGIELSFLGGMLAVSLVSQKATGAAMGMVGLLAYFGATLQEIVNGRLMDLSKVVSNGVTTYDFSTIIQFWVVSTALMVAFVVPVLIAQIRKEHNEHNAAAEDAIHD
jgi:OPA family sugar phosphate sensor protein UhpC-like MFS transporter